MKRTGRNRRHLVLSADRDHCIGYFASRGLAMRHCDRIFRRHPKRAFFRIADCWAMHGAFNLFLYCAADCRLTPLSRRMIVQTGQLSFYDVELATGPWMQHDR
jgi:hypothetical protein